MGLSKIDLKVLRFALENGAQMHDAEIAKQLRLKPSTVTYVLKKMRRERTILSYRYRLDYHRLGFPALAWVLFKLKAGGMGLQDVLERLLLFPQVHVASFVTGSSDIALKVMERDVVAINDFVLRVSNELKDVIESPAVLFATKSFKTHNIALESRAPCPKLDAADFEILNSKMLAPDVELKALAKRLRLHRNTVGKRWRQLWKEKVLLKKTPVVNPAIYGELGLGLKAIVFIDISNGRLQRVVRGLLKTPAVHELNQLLSGHDLMAVVRVRDVAEFFDFLKHVSERPEVKQTVSRIILHSKPHHSNYLLEMSRAGMLPFELSQVEAGNQ